MQSSQCIPLTPRTLSESLSSFAVVSAAATSMDCGFPGSPRNGSLVGSGIRYQAQEEVAYQCSPGFVLFGPTKRQCLSNGTWSGAIPECRNFSYFHFAAVQCIIWLINFFFFLVEWWIFVPLRFTMLANAQPSFKLWTSTYLFKVWLWSDSTLIYSMHDGFFIIIHHWFVIWQVKT